MLSFSSKAIPVNMLASTIVNALPSNIRTKVDGGMSSGISVNDKPTQSTVSVPASYVQPASSMEAVSVGRGKCSKFVPGSFCIYERQNTYPMSACGTMGETTGGRALMERIIRQNQNSASTSGLSGWYFFRKVVDELKTSCTWRVFNITDLKLKMNKTCERKRHERNLPDATWSIRNVSSNSASKGAGEDHAMVQTGCRAVLRQYCLSFGDSQLLMFFDDKIYQKSNQSDQVRISWGVNLLAR